MTFNIQTTLKRSHGLVFFVRALRNTPAYLRGIMSEIEREGALEKLITKRNDLIADYTRTEPVKKLHIGAGSNRLEGWLNTDLIPETPDILYLDATVKLPFVDSTFQYVYSEHMIEHVPYKGALTVFREAYRILQPGGKIRVSTPDTVKIVSLLSLQKSAGDRKYIAWSAGELIGLYYKEKSRLQERRPEWDIDLEHIKKFYPDIEVDPAPFVVNILFRGFGHQFLHTEQTIRALLEDAGFIDVVRYTPGVSDDDQLRGLESHGVVIGEDMNSYESMVFEATKIEVL
ncbi:MAG: hypothetical protein A2W33_05765 [Chloroflexi bacterium RBG_16_52_11]|nr:MAG: hypothetical protein A2W33_05765 [Chloroflexi bacterium RBG_16_52_11]